MKSDDIIALEAKLVRVFRFNYVMQGVIAGLGVLCFAMGCLLVWMEPSFFRVVWTAFMGIMAVICWKEWRREMREYHYVKDRKEFGIW